MNDQVYEFLINSTGLVEIVGFGSYGEVKLAMNRKSGEIVAIKMVVHYSTRSTIRMPKNKSTSIINYTTTTSSNF